MSGLLILGAGGHAKVVAETAISCGVASSVAFLDDRCSSLDVFLSGLGWPVIGPLALALQADTSSQFDAAVVAIGHASTRLHWIQQLQDIGYHLPVLMHPTAWVSPSAHLGPASVVFAQVAVQAQVSIEQARFSIPVAASITTPNSLMACTSALALAWPVM